MKIRLKTMVDNEGEPQKTRIEIPIEGGGGVLGKRAVIKLTALMDRFRYTETEFDIFQHYYMICGYITCCRDSGFLTGESATDLMQLAEQLADNEIIRVREAKKKGQ